MTLIHDLLGDLLARRGAAVAAWFAERYARETPPFYASVDIRHSGDKLVPVDTNLFPAGFNNLSPAGLARAAELLAARMQALVPGARNVLIIPESHTRNQGYIDNLATLAGLFTRLGYATAIGRVGEDARPVTLTASTGEILRSVPIRRAGERIVTIEGFDPDFLLVNNDFTSRPPAMLCGIAQAIAPCPTLGWYQRRKSVHFAAYDRVCHEFGETFGVDPWHLTARFHACGRVQFRERTGLDCVAKAVDELAVRVREETAARGIDREPYVFVKADSGTYGMGVMTARTGADVLSMNKKTRHSMDVIKEGAPNADVVIQEGIPSVDTVGGKTAEALIYLIGGEVAGGIWRVHGERDRFASLNTPGMRFAPMEESPALAAASLVARLASLAAAREEYEGCGGGEGG